VSVSHQPRRQRSSHSETPQNRRPREITKFSFHASLQTVPTIHMHAKFHVCISNANGCNAITNEILLTPQYKRTKLLFNGLLLREFIIMSRCTKGPFIATQLNSTRRRAELRRRVAIDTSPTQLNSPRHRVELSCVGIDTLTDATQLSPTIGNAIDPVEQRTANQREAGQSCSQWCIVMCDIPTSDVHFLRTVF